MRNFLKDLPNPIYPKESRRRERVIGSVRNTQRSQMRKFVRRQPPCQRKG